MGSAGAVDDDVGTLRRHLAARRAEVHRLRSVVKALRKSGGSADPTGRAGPTPAADPWRAQVSTVTAPARHRDLVADLADALAEVPDPVVLSFGCSTGFELLDLRAALPKARVLGCDVNVLALEEARSRCEPLGIAVFASTPEAISAFGPFDAICAFNVLLRFPAISGRDDISAIYPFEGFERHVGELCRAIRPGGLLALYNTCYSLQDTASGPAFQALPAGRQPHNGWVDRYDRHGRLTARAGFLRDGREYTVAEWHQKLLADDPSPPWFKQENAPCEHVLVADVPPPDLATTLWRKREARAPGWRGRAPRGM